MMCMGREVRLPGDFVYGTTEDDRVPLYRAHVQAIQEHMLHAHEVARRHLKVTKNMNKLDDPKTK